MGNIRSAGEIAGAALPEIPSDRYGEGTPELVFLHGNGYPPGCYGPLLSKLAKDHCVWAMHQRPLWPGSTAETLTSWKPLSEDLLRFLDERRIGKATVVGHSLGGVVLLRAAIQNPERFNGLVLIDPVLFTPMAIRSWSVVRGLGLARRFHPWIHATERRRVEFDELDQLFHAYRRRPVFKYMSDAHLRAYIEGITRPKAGGGYSLRYSPTWEVHIYLTGIWPDMDLWRGLPNLRLPVLFIRGAESDTFLEVAVRRVRGSLPAATIRAVDSSTHLVPLERPDEVADLIQEFLKELA